MMEQTDTFGSFVDEPRAAGEQASQVLALIENRLNQLNAQVAAFMEFLTRTPAGLATSDFSGVHWTELEDFAPHCRNLAGHLDVRGRADLAYMLAARFKCNPFILPRTAAAFQLDQPAVRQSYRAIYGPPPRSGRPATGAAAKETLNQAVLRLLRQELELVSISRGEILLRESEEGDALYFIISGRLIPAVRDEKGQERFLPDRGRGEVMGEMALLTGYPRSATVYAMRDSILWKLSRPGFERLVAIYPHLTMLLARVAIDSFKLEAAGKHTFSAPRTIAFIPASPDIPLTGLCQDLVRALSEFGSCLRLDSDSYRQHQAESGAGADYPARMLSWLTDHEIARRFLIFQADPGFTAWTERCLRQCDRVVLVGLAGNSPAPGEIETEVKRRNLLWQQVGQELVLLYPGGVTRPAATAGWLAGRQIRRHYHLDPAAPADLKRLARGLAGKSLGVVFGSGGARGFSHIGVIRALQELGVPVDIVGGTSAGAIAAAALAHRDDYRVSLEKSRLLLSTFTDYTFPAVSLVKGQNFLRALQKLFGDTRIEDLPLEFFCVSSNLSAVRQEIHRRGLLYRAIRASCSLPGIFPPWLENDELLVDGAILNPVPGDVMAGICEGGTIIASDITVERTRRGEFNYGESVSGWQVLFNQALRRKQPNLKTPDLLNVLGRSAMLGSMPLREANRQKASLYLTPPVEQFGTADVHRDAELVEIGYRYALEKIARWKETVQL